MPSWSETDLRALFDKWFDEKIAQREEERAAKAAAFGAARQARAAEITREREARRAQVAKRREGRKAPQEP